MWQLTTCKVSVSLSFLNWIKNEMIFYCISELMLATIIQRYEKKIISFQERETNWSFTGCQVPHFMIVLIPFIGWLYLSWIIKCLFLRNMEPLNYGCQIGPVKVLSEVIISHRDPSASMIHFSANLPNTQLTLVLLNKLKCHTHF